MKMTRREYRDAAGLPQPGGQVYDVNSLYPSPYEPVEVEPASWLARTRKAHLAGLATAAGVASPLILAATADGAVSWQGEVLPAVVVSLGAGVAAWLTVWAVPNAD